MVELGEIRLGPNYYIHTKKDGTSEPISMYQILDCWYGGYVNKGCLFWVTEQQRWTLLADYLGEEVGPRTKMPKEIPPPPPQLAKPTLPDKAPVLIEMEEILTEITDLPHSERESEYRDWRTTLRNLEYELEAKIINDNYYFNINGALVGPIRFLECMRLQEIKYITEDTPCWDYYTMTWHPFLEINQRKTTWFNALRDFNKDGPFDESSGISEKYDEIDISILTKLGIAINENV